MGKTIVFLNLADMHKEGLAKTSVAALKLKYPRYKRIYECFAGSNQVYLVDLFGLLQEQQQPMQITNINALTRYMPILNERLAITQLCSSADKIMLGVHGHFDDTDQGFAGLGWERGSGVIGNYREFAELIAGFFLPNQSYKLSLIICFGARSQNYRINHDGLLNEDDIKSSFAYKFYKEICTKAAVTMTARTGSVSFDTQSGRSLVQTEAAVSAEIENAEIQADDETKRIAQDYQRFEASMSGKIEEFFDIYDRMSDPQAIAVTPQEKIVKDYKTIQTRVTELSSSSAEMVSKYGKFVYTYNDGIVTVCRKYEGKKKVMKIIYQGAL
jgi:hypothetical protein